MNKLITAVIIGGVFYILGQYVASNPDRERQATEADRTITVTGSATISTRPDTAQLTVGTKVEAVPTAEAALEQLAAQFNQVVAAVKQQGVAEDDIVTSNFSLQPQYDYREGKQALRGYGASENIIITIRDLATIGTIISSTTQAGANQVGSVSFEMADDSPAVRDAEAAAIADAREKAEHLSKELKVNLGPVKSYQAFDTGPQPYYARAELSAIGTDLAKPEIPIGTTDTNVTVSITFELR